MRDHVMLWRNHLFDISNNRFKRVFRFLTDKKVILVDNKDQFGEAAYEKILRIFYNRGPDIEQIGLTYDLGEPFYQFLRGKPGFEGLTEVQAIGKAYLRTGRKSRDLQNEFLEQMPRDERGRFGFHYRSFDHLLLDLENQETVSHRLNGRNGIKGTFVDAETVQLQALDYNGHPIGEKILVKPGSQSGPGENVCLLADVPTPARFMKEGLYPLFAWRNQNGQRTFLTQEEADQLRGKIPAMSGIDADVMLGRLQLVPLHPKVKENLPEKLALRGVEPRPVRATAVGVLASLDFLPPLQEGGSIRPGRAKLILTEENGVLAKLEQHAKRLAA